MKSGKTAPRLLQDLLSLDPRTASIGKNVLADPAPIFDDPDSYVPLLPLKSCRHLYTIKYSQSAIPPLDSRPEQNTKWRIASVCQNCRCHLTLTINFGGSSGAGLPCPNAERPLHFFVLQSRREPQEPWASRSFSCKAREREYSFQCISPSCSVTVWINLSPPRLTSDQISLLADSYNLRSRYEAAVAADPGRNFEEANGALALYRLRAYLRDSLDPKSHKSHFPKKNRYFIATFGHDCDAYLRSIGFTDENDPEEGSIWRIPRPSPKDDIFDQTSHRPLLEDLIEELSILIIKRPPIERQTIRNFVYQPLQARRDLERVLGMLDYEKATSSRKYDSNTLEHPYYASLGAVADFSDNLLLYSHDRQVECDVGNSPYYFECLQDLAKGRNSEALQTRVATLASQGQLSRKDIAKAYRYFGVNEKHLGVVTDDHILGLFQSRLPDIGPSQESEIREMLRTLARVRNSESLSHAASDTIETYSQALSWLGAEESTADDFILTLFKMKIDENGALREIAQKALQLIANERKSEDLENYLSTGEMNYLAIDPADAYRILDIPDRTLDDDFILSVYETRQQDAPAREKEFYGALKAIAKDRGSQKLADAVKLDHGFISHAGPLVGSWDESPVGLHNLANTCYLNSVLQLFFSLKPFREIVLNFEHHKMDITPAALQVKRVGSAIRTIEEIELSQQFTSALGDLFRTMIHTEERVAKYPTELARLALVILSKDLMTRRRSTVSGDRPNLAEDNHQLQSVPEIELDSSQQNAALQVTGSRSSSQDTLVDVSLAESAGNEELKDVSMTDIDTMQAGISKDTGLSTQTAEASGTNKRIKRQNSLDEAGDDTMMIDTLITVSRDGDGQDLATLATGGTSTTANHPPTRAAPKPELPPRQKKESRAASERLAVEDIARQQDAAEVTDNVLAKVRIAIRATGFDNNGEQLDPVRELLFGMQRNVTTRPDGQETTQIEMLDNIRLPLHTPLYIYEALDNYFDIQDKVLDGVTVQGHSSIDSAPPVLGLQIGRIYWDATKQMATKTEHHLKLEEVIYLDRYLTSDSAEMDGLKRHKWQLKKERAALEAERAALNSDKYDLNTGTVLMSLAGFAQDVARSSDDDDPKVPFVTDEFVEMLADAGGDQAVVMHEKDEAIEQLSREILDLFAHMKSHPYRLYALCIHSGTVGFGHYWVYIHDFENDVWRKYNDETVSIVDYHEIFKPLRMGNHIATPHYIIYVRDDIKERLTEPLYRKASDVEMEDAGI